MTGRACSNVLGVHSAPMNPLTAIVAPLALLLRTWGEAALVFGHAPTTTHCRAAAPESHGAVAVAPRFARGALRAWCTRWRWWRRRHEAISTREHANRKRVRAE